MQIVLTGESSLAFLLCLVLSFLLFMALRSFRLLISLLSGDGLNLRPSGIIGSIVGAVIVTAVQQWWTRRASRG